MSYIATLTLPLIEKWQKDTLDKNERRDSVCGALDQFQRQTEGPRSILSDKVRANIKISAGIPVKIPVINNQAVTIGNARSCTISANEQTSALITLNFFTMVSSFSIYPDQFAFNYVGYQADYETKLTNLIYNWRKYIDTYCRNILETNKNIYFPTNITNYFPVTGNALQVPQSAANDAFNQLHAVLNEMDMAYAAPSVIASTSTQPLIMRLKNQSSGNAINEAFQLAPFNNWSWSNRVTNNTGIANTVYLVPDGNLAIENRNLPGNLAKNKIGVDYKEWDEVMLPDLGMKVGTFYSKDCADGSTPTGESILTQTMVENFEFSTDICVVTAYNSSPSTQFTPILKVEISAT